MRRAVDCPFSILAIEGETVGRQVNFWMTSNDELAFVDRLRRDDVVWCPYAIPFGTKPTLHELDDWRPIDKGQRIVLIRRCDSNLLMHENIRNSKLAGMPPIKPWTMVGTEGSPSFQWKCCVRKCGAIRRGRIYLKTTWLENNILRAKSPEHIRWFDNIADWLRRKGRKWEYRGQYLMPDAAKLADAGELTIEVLLHPPQFRRTTLRTNRKMAEELP